VGSKQCHCFSAHSDFSRAMTNLRVLCRDQPQRTIALVSSEYALVFHYTSADTSAKDSPRCQVELSDLGAVDLKGYRPLGYGYGTLGLVTLNEDVFVCVVTSSSQAATVRPGETVSRIDNVGFCMFPMQISGRIIADDFRLSQSFRIRVRPRL
jgi:hypothetical protein